MFARTAVFHWFSSWILAASLAACGGGGGSGGSSGPDEPAALAGSLSPVPIAGIDYRTDTTSGTTDASGEFRYRAGEQVEFRLGDTVLGVAEGAETLTLFDLAGAAMLSEVEEIEAALDSGDHPYVAATNLIRLLHSLDEDRDADNGIAIGEQARDLFGGEPLEFGQLPRLFAYSAPVWRVLEGVDRVLVNRNIALAQQYQAGDIPLNVRGRRLSRPLNQEITAYSNAAPVSSSRAEITYDALGNPLSEVQYDNGGELNRRTDYRYDGAGYSELVEYDTDGDGAPDTRNRAVSRNPAGNVVDILRRSGEALENVTRERRFFNQRGLQVRSEQDRDDDGSIDTLYRTHYLDNDLAGRFEADTDGDGVSDQIQTFDYNSEDLVVHSTYDGEGPDFSDSFDGMPPQLGSGPEDAFDPTTAYPEAGSAFVVGGLNSPVSRDTTFERNSAGYLTRRSTDTDGDGRANRVTEFEYNQAQLVAWRHDGENDGVFESFAQYRYDDRGWLVEVKQTRDRTYYVSRELRTLYYDDAGRRTRLVVAGDSGNPNNGEYRYGYDELGNVSETSVDYGPDGSLDAQALTEWEGSYRLDDAALQ